MDYRTLGRNGVKVSPICLGTMMFGGQTDDETAGRIIQSAREQGVNFIDTADVYSSGKSEEVIGRLIAHDRDDWVLATKFGNFRKPGPNHRGGSRKALFEAVDASLRRLNTDYIDLLYLHIEDHSTPVAETVGALGDLIRQGKVLYYGVSNHRAWKLAEFSQVADQLGVPRPAATQPCYNLANRQPEVEHFAAAEYYGIGVAPFSPLARGVLTAKYEPGAAPASDSRAGRNDKRIQETEFREESLQLAQTIKRHAQERGLTAGQFALAWVVNNRLITSAVTGPRTLEQWEAYLPALTYRWTPQDEALIDSLVAPGHPSTPGFNDPAHPFVGRRPSYAG